MTFDIQGAKSAGYSDAEIADYLGQQKKFDVSGARKAGYSDGEIVSHFVAPASDQPAYDPTADMPTSQRFLAGTGKAFMDTYRGLQQLAAQAGIGDLSSIQKEIDASRKRDAPLMDTTAGTVGNLVGNVAQGVGLPGGTTIKGAALVGSILAGAQPTSEGESRLMNAGVGAVLGAGGQAVAKGIGAVVRGPQNALTPAEQALAAKAPGFGIDLTPGQQTGNKFLRTVESQLERSPSTSSAATKANQAQGEQFTRALTKTFGEDSPILDEATMKAAKTRLGQNYDNIFQGERIKLDGEDLIAKLAKANEDAYKYLTPADAKIVQNRTIDLIGKVGDDGAVDGLAYQKWRSSANAANGDVNFYLKQVKGAVDEAASNSLSPEKMQLFSKTQQQYKNMKTAKPLAEKSVNGMASPALLLERVRASYPNMAFGEGGDIADLARVGKAFVRDPVPDSGTSQRMLVQGLMSGGMGGGAYAATGDPQTALKAAGGAYAAQFLGPKMVQGLMQNPAFKKYLTGGLLSGAIDPRLVEGLLRGSTALPVAGLLAAR